MNWGIFVANEIAPALRSRGYRKSGLRFSRDLPEVIHLVALQKSQVSNRNMVRLTVNLGVYSKAVGEALGRPTIDPPIEECHWRLRIGNLRPDDQDYW